MRDVAIVGAAMTRFGKYPDKGLKELSREAVEAALGAAGLEKKDLQIDIVGNAAARPPRRSCARWGSTRSLWSTPRTPAPVRPQPCRSPGFMSPPACTTSRSH